MKTRENLACSLLTLAGVTNAETVTNGVEWNRPQSESIDPVGTQVTCTAPRITRSSMGKLHANSPSMCRGLCYMGLTEEAELNRKYTSDTSRPIIWNKIKRQSVEILGEKNTGLLLESPSKNY